MNKVTTDKETPELYDWQRDLVAAAEAREVGYTVVRVPKGAGKSTVAAVLARNGAHVVVSSSAQMQRLLEYGAIEELIYVSEIVGAIDLDGVHTIVFDDVKPPEEWLELLKDKLVIYLCSSSVSEPKDCPCGSELCAKIQGETALKQLTVDQDFTWDGEAKILTYGEQTFSWMPDWKLPDWATGRVFYFSTLGSPEALNKTRFDRDNKNRVAGSLVGEPINKNHKKYELQGQNIIVDTEVIGERLEGICYVENQDLLEEYDAGNVVGCSIDYKDRNFDKVGDYDVEGAFGLGLAWVTKPNICGYPDSLVWESTEVPEDMGIESKVMTDSMVDFVDKELLAQRTVVFQGYVGGGSCAELTKMLEYLGSINQEPIRVILNSGGGSVYAGLLAFDTIKRLVDAGVEVTCEVRGLAASMGAIIIQAGTHRVATPNTRFLIHEVSSWAWGKTSEMEEEIREIKKVNDMLKSIIAERTGKTMEEIESVWHKKDVWLSAEEALEFGLIDEIIEGDTKTQTHDGLVTKEVWFSWLNSLELRFDGLLAKSMSATEVFKRLEKEEEDDDDDDDDDEGKTLTTDILTEREVQAIFHYEISPILWGELSDTQRQNYLDGMPEDTTLDLDGEDDEGEPAVPPSSKNTLAESTDSYFAFIEDGGDAPELRHLQFRDEDGYDAVLLLAAMEDLQQMIFSGDISKSASEAAKFQLMEGFKALNLKIPEWATRDNGDIQSDRLSPKTRAQLRRSWNDRADFPRRFHRDRMRRRLGVDPGPVTDVSQDPGKEKGVE